MATHTISQMEQWSNNPALPFLEDHHFYWRESTCERVLDALKPCLHPFLANNAFEFVDGLVDLAEGRMSVTLRTQCLIKDFVKLDASPRKGATLQRNDSAIAIEDSQHPDLDAALTQPAATSVEVSCMRGALWDPSSSSVLLREGPTRGLSCIRVERKKGVRLRDVVDELRGVLLPASEASVHGTLLLEWRLEDDAR